MPAKTLEYDLNIKGYADHNNHEIRNVLIQALGSDPTGVEAKIIWRSDTKTLRYYDGTTWNDLSSATNSILKSLIDAKGDLLVGTADNTVARKAVGANNTFLTGDSAVGDGLTWRALVASDIQEKIATSDLTDWPRVAALDLNNQKITGLADGTAATDAASFGQINAILQGRKWKEPVRVVATTNITLSGTQTIDGVAVIAGDRVLAGFQTTAANSGIYVVAAGAWTRATDADTGVEITQATVFSFDGAGSKGDEYTQSAAITTIGTDAQTWTKTGEGNTAYLADGTTLQLTGVTFSILNGGVTGTQLNASVAGAGLAGGGGSALSINVSTGIEINADAIRLATPGNGLTGGAGVAYAVNAGNGIIADGSSTRVDPAVVARGASGVLTGGSNSEVLTHNLNTRKVRVMIRNPSTPWDEIEVYNEATSVNSVTIYAATGNNLPASYVWLVLGVQ